MPEVSVADATERALAAATHLDDTHAGAIEALRAVARKIDAWDQIVEWAIEDARSTDGKESRPKVPQNDNVSLPTYLKFCESLGLTPLGQTKLPKQEKPAANALDDLAAKRNRRAGRKSA